MIDLTGYNYVDCRDLRHAWTEVNAYPTPDKPQTTAVVYHTRELRCLRCATLRVEEFKVFRSTGVVDKTANKYRYSEGYVMKRNEHVRASDVAQQARFLAILSRLST